MKLPRVEYRKAESLGRHDVGALGAKGAALDNESRAQQQAVSLMTEVASDYIQRKQDAEYNDAKTEYSTTYSAWREKYDAKEFYSADDLGDIPENLVPRYDVTVNDQGEEVRTKRTSIPAYEVYPHLQQKMLEGLNSTISDKIGHPDMRNEFLRDAEVFSANQEMTSGIEAEEQQQEYGRKVALDRANQLAIAGDREMALFTINNGEFTEQEKLEHTRKANEIYEWEQDTRILNMLDIPAMKVRLAQLTSEEYGNAADEHLGPGKSSGAYNQAADIARFKSAIATATSTRNNTNSQRVEEHIKAISLGGLGPKNIFYNDNGTINTTLISKMGFSESKAAKLEEDLRMAMVHGSASQAFLDTNVHQDKVTLDQAYQAVTKSAADNPDFTNESLEYYEAAQEAYARKMERLTTDGYAYVVENSPGVQASLRKLGQMPDKADAQLQAAYMQEHLAVVRAEQQRLGLTEQEVNFLAPSQVSGVKQQLMEASRSSNGAADAVGLLTQMEQQYGQEFPAVYSQLLREGALEEEHIAMMIYEDPADRIGLAQVINQKDEIYADRIVIDNLSEIRLDVQTSMLPIVQSLIPDGAMPTVSSGASTHKQLSAWRDAAILQVSASVMSTGSYDPGKVAQYTMDIFNKSYDLDNETRIPKNRGHNPEKIFRGIAVVQSGRGYTFSDDLVFAMQSPAGLAPTDNQILLKEEFGRSIRVVTNSDETGVTYLWTNGKPVEIMDGGRAVPLTSRFADLESMEAGLGGRYPSKARNNLRLGPSE